MPNPRSFPIIRVISCHFFPQSKHRSGQRYTFLGSEDNYPGLKEGTSVSGRERYSDEPC